MTSRRNSDPQSKDLKALKKDQLIRIIQESQSKDNSPNSSKRNSKTVEADATKSSFQFPKCSMSMLPDNEAGMGWLLAQIKESVVEAVQELKTELRQEYKTLLKGLEDKFTEKINDIQNDMNAIRNRVDAYFVNFEKEVLNDLRETEQRKDNVMIFGLKESNASSSSECIDHDMAHITRLSSELGVSHLQIGGCFRLGRRSSRPRPIKVICQSSRQRTDLLRSAYNIPKLDSDLGFRRIFIKPDLSPKEQEADRQLRRELKRRREGGERVVIRNGRIVEMVDAAKQA